jgi:hypothetical protein
MGSYYETLLIRHRREGLETTYLVVDAVKLRPVAGPFGSLDDAVRTASSLIRPGGSVWQETADRRAKPIDAKARPPLCQRG